MYTPPTFTNLQEVFDFATNHLLTQGVRSIDEFGHCKYRGPNGLMCVAGAFIPRCGICARDGGH